ncbi:sugar ABC transporter substrate-binding protein [Actinomyces sp. oral taxon 181]|uniref:sugar ABC transporter substrate-binding protein n=1 Tax=Actinomyces sp. oral taxon 181 TaxID=712121 RepID=UPI0002A416EC|nr:extracellular solute-binding protein [Actinomyces sp. oral taxon 181]EKY14198.1 ABC transporter, solute-binding protein [Actinomyces sp. oral taxon 181 str. F0379]
MAYASKRAMRGIAFFGAGVMALGLAACSGTKTDSADSGSASGGQVTVEMWDYLSGETANDSINAAIAEFEKANPDIKVKRTTFAFADLSKSILQGSVGGQVPDVAVVDVVDNQNFASLGMLKDLSNDGINKSDFFEGPWSSVVYEGKTYGIPLNSNNLALYYNKQMLKDAGVEVPTDWASLKEVAKKTTKGDVKGIAISAVKSESATFQILPFVWQTGGDLKDYATSGATALAYLRGLIDDGSMSEAVSNYTQEDARTQFITGKSAMMINGPWELATLTKDAQFDWDVAPLPKDKRAATSMGGENVVVMNGAKQSDAAVKLAKFLTSAEGAKIYCDGSGQLSSRPDLQGKLKLSNDAKLKVFESQLADAHARAYGKDYPKISEAIQLSMQEALTGASTPEAAAKKAADSINPLLPKN